MLTVGGILKREREKQKMSLEEIEKVIKVRRKFLEAIEQDDWTLFSSKIYITGVIKNYAKVLRLPEDKVLAFFRREYAKKEVTGFQTKVPSKLLDSGTKKYLGLGLGLLICVFVLYFGYQLFLFFAPPNVDILLPKETVFKRTDKIKILGKTEREAQIMIFGNRIYQNKEGVFVYDYPLKKGKNFLVIEVTGANGKKTTIRREYTLRQ
ncbi:helix-turn-helix domain-containing protein [Candidatus Microgenomates bacterium]|nr:helix-turn-helix domain-containing protein [Candidatus Microgenomates bacterium]